MAQLPSENPQRHKAGVNDQRAPRPYGVAPGVPWQPRQPLRNYTTNQLTVRFLEALDAYPQLQRWAAAAIGVVASLVVPPEGPPPPDVPNEPGSWTFAALGDYGAGTVQQARVAANIMRTAPQLVITVGDNVYPTGRWQDYAKNWDPPQFMGRLARSVPFMPALGNHDMYRDDLRPYFGHFPHLQGRAYYSFVHRDAHFMALDSDQDLRPGSAQRRWLEQELKASGSRWRVVYLHYPLYGSNLRQYTEIRESLQPLLERHGVQLLLAGHEHNYLRSRPIGKVMHVLTGGGGQQVYPFTAVKPAHIARRQALFHHVEVSVGARNLVLRAIDEHGARIDTVTVPWWGPAAQAREGATSASVSEARRRRRARAGEAATRS